MPAMPLLSRLRLALFVLVPLALASCGGGGGGGGGFSFFPFPPPSPSPPVAKYAVGGNVSGLQGSGLVLQLAGAADVAVVSNGAFVFSDKLDKGTSYAVSVKQQPSTPSQTCTVNNASGTIGDADVANVAVICATTGQKVSIAVTGLDAAGGLVLQNNAGDDLAVNADGTFSFATPVAIGADYGVTVKTQPTALQVCIAKQAFGTVTTTAPIASVTIACTAPGADRFAFTANENTNNIVRFKLAADGQLITAAGPDGPIALPTGGAAQHVAVNPEGKTVYAGNATSTTVPPGPRVVAQYSIAPDGTLTQLPDVSTNVGSFPVFVGIEPKGKFAYVVGDGAIHRFGIDATTGALVNGAAFPGAGGARKISFDPDGRFAFAPNSGTVSVYRLDPATGDPISPPASVAQPSVQDIAIDPTGRFAYADSPAPTVGAPGTLSAYAIDATTGALTLIGSVPTGDTPFGLAVDPTGRFVYAANRNDNNVSAYAIDPRTGALTPVPGQPFATGSVPNSVTVDRTGRFAYTANQVNNTITFFTIDRNTGALGAGTNQPSVGAGPQFLALTK